PLAQVYFNQVLDGDFSSLTQAGPEFLRAFDLNEAADIFAKTSGALEQVNFKQVLDGDLKSLTGAMPQLLQSFGLDGAADIMSKAEGALNALNISELLNGNFDSLKQAAPELLRGFGFDGAADVFESMDGLFDNLFGDAADEVEDKKAKKRPRAKRKAAKKSKMGRKSKGFKTTSLGKLLKGPASKMLGKVAAPITAVLGALDIFSTLSDDSLTSSQKTKQVATSAGGTGGALAGAAAGAAIGSIIPGIGTIIGGLIGGALGAFAGESLGEAVGNSLTEDSNPPPIATEKQLSAPVNIKGNVKNNLQQLSSSRIQTLNRPAVKPLSNTTSQKSAAGSTITVTNEITVNAAPGMDAKTIAEEVKNQLENREMAALRNNRFNYLDEVA
ncbi:MAG: hypothetical protein MJK04_02765, partial [Psychrosphaera sp.]|nr:hypothetical protein [Psychrosphaera sp.]